MKKCLGMCLLILCLASPSWANAKKITKTERGAQVKTSTAELRARLEGRFPAATVQSIFDDPRFAIDWSLVAPPEPPTPVPPPPPKPKKPKYSYMFTNTSLALGIAYLGEHAATLDAAASEYNVPKEVIAGILRIETKFGDKDHLGTRPVITTLYTRYTFPRGRTPEKRKEKREGAYLQLVAFLKTCDEQGWDPFSKMGSWEGAMGIPQYMPSSYRDHALTADGNGDGIVDLWNHDDAIMSAAKYLHEFGFGKTRKSQERAVHAYNKEGAYVRAVLLYARKLKALETQEKITPPRKETAVFYF